jgi:hypothetical protein
VPCSHRKRIIPNKETWRREIASSLKGNFEALPVPPSDSHRSGCLETEHHCAAQDNFPAFAARSFDTISLIFTDAFAPNPWTRVAFLVPNPCHHWKRVDDTATFTKHPKLDSTVGTGMRPAL